MDEIITKVRYITVQQFIDHVEQETTRRFTEKTVRQWFEKGLILGAVKNEITGEIEIPEDTLAPYTQRKKGEGVSYFSSALSGMKKHYEVFGRVYGQSEEMFRISVMSVLIEQGLVKEIRVKDKDYVYYRPTVILENMALREISRYVKPLNVSLNASAGI